MSRYLQWRVVSISFMQDNSCQALWGSTVTGGRGLGCGGGGGGLGGGGGGGGGLGDGDDGVGLAAIDEF